MYFFSQLCFCIFRHVVTSVLRNRLFVWLLAFLLVDIVCVFTCLPFFLKSFMICLIVFCNQITHVCNCLMFAGCWRCHFLVLGRLLLHWIHYVWATDFSWCASWHAWFALPCCWVFAGVFRLVLCLYFCCLNHIVTSICSCSFSYYLTLLLFFYLTLTYAYLYRYANLLITLHSSKWSPLM